MQLSRYFCTAGVLAGTFFFALSLTPMLLPRSDVVQGVISGLSLAAGYGLGVFGRWLWRYLELPIPRSHVKWGVQLAAAFVCVIIAVAFLWQASTWQNTVRGLMGMEETDGLQPLVVGGVALLLFAAVLLLSKLFRRTILLLSGKLQRFISRPVSNVVGLLVAFFLFWSVIDGIFFEFALRAADRSYQQVDALMEAEVEKPIAPTKTGSTESLANWSALGRQGRRFISSGPTAADLADYFDSAPVKEPLRVYIGINSADTPEDRAALALEELKRVGAFDRSVLLLITPTGTGWVDPAGMDTVEYLHRGDVASVAVQYSYLPSILSLLLEGEYGSETARSLFEVVYAYWTTLPKESRPALYLYGVSLGALNSDRSFDLYDIIDDPFQGALWCGPPFRSDTWRKVTERRQPDSPARLPVFRNGSVVRFANQEKKLDALDQEWGDFRIAYLQYASDPVTFFEPQAFFREPQWMREPRGPDVSPDLQWFPIVTGLQLIADVVAGSAPPGYGHIFAAGHYIDAWRALTEPPQWSENELQRLREYFDTES